MIDFYVGGQTVALTLLGRSSNVSSDWQGTNGARQQEKFFVDTVQFEVVCFITRSYIIVYHFITFTFALFNCTHDRISLSLKVLENKEELRRVKSKTKLFQNILDSCFYISSKNNLFFSNLTRLFVFFCRKFVFIR